ncbi:MAG: DUF3800 domain-containing protein [Candidatus Staskawiczbacteria bacterium]|nr:DUF3800 domain-containing protein [Candidatus Staskawiczbacteria bacterium]
MAYIFLDESGDLGFNFKKKKTSKFFVITFLATENKKVIEKIVKRTHSELAKKYKRKFGVLHATKDKPIIRQRLLKRLSEKECIIMAIYLNKKKVYTNLREEKSVLYNYVANILLDRICTKKIITEKDSVELIASRRETNKFLNENFRNYIDNQARSQHKININVKIKTPFEEKSLQAVDYVSWSIFRKYEYGDDSYYNLIKNKITEESPLFP